MGNCCFSFTSVSLRSTVVLPLYPSKKSVKILSLDGGGIRGLIQLIVLMELERITKKPIFELFDLIVGTSIGGIIALGLTTPKVTKGTREEKAGSEKILVEKRAAVEKGNGKMCSLYTAKEMFELLLKNANAVFHRSILKRIQSLGGLRDEKYSSKALEDLLSCSLGSSLLSNSLTLLFLPSFDLSSYSTQFFRSYDPKRDYLRKLVGRAISAAPTYFELAIVDSIQKNQNTVNVNSGEKGKNEKNEGEKDDLSMLKPLDSSKNDTFYCIDGGVVLNNPALAGYVEARRIFPNAINFLVLSVGCGREMTKFSVSSARAWGVLEWIEPLIDIMMDGRDDEIDRQMRGLLEEGYVRWQFELKEGLEKFDDASENNLEGLLKVGNEWVNGRKGELDKLCKILVG